MLPRRLDTLQRKTRAYWIISQAKRGTLNTELDTCTAIDVCNELSYTLNPARPLYKHARHLLHVIVDGDIPVSEIPAKTIQLKR